MQDLLPKTKEICRFFNIKPERSKGQNFLVDSHIYDEVVLAAKLDEQDEVLEVGPGLGFLTVRLASQAKKVVAVELDDNLAAYLQTGFSATDDKKVTVINQDILRFNAALHLSAGYKIVANLPYNITSIFLRTFLSSSLRPSLIVLMLQKEVAERIVAQAPDMSLLAVSVQHYAEAEIVKIVKADSFWPVPAIDSAIIKLRLRPLKFTPEEDKLFFRLVKAGFSAKRKMLKNNLVGGLLLSTENVSTACLQAGIEMSARAESLSLENWYKLFAALRVFMV